ncbi:hypothetical protein SGLAM104S_07014 [Streptomyces glaucescens]
MPLARALPGERGLTQAYDVEEAVEQAVRGGGGHRGAGVAPLEEEPFRAQLAQLPGADVEQQIAGLGEAVRLRGPDCFAAERRARRGHFAVDRVGQGARPRDQDTSRAEGTEGLRGQPGGIRSGGGRGQRDPLGARSAGKVSPAGGARGRGRSPGSARSEAVCGPSAPVGNFRYGTGRRAPGTAPGPQGRTGSRTVNSVRPGTLATSMVPPCARTRDAATDRPRPLPPRSRLRALSTR